MKFTIFSACLSIVLAGRTTSPVPLGATAVAMAAPSPAPPSSNWLSKIKYYFKQPQQSKQEILGDSFDRYLTNAVVQYHFSGAEDLGAFKEATATLVVDTWFVDDNYGVVCLAASQMDTFDRLLPTKLRDTKLVTDADVHRSVIKTFPLHSVELPDQDFANATEVMRYINTFSTLDLGHSWEGRPITAILPAEESTRAPTSKKKSTLYVCGVHGREWASVSVCLSLLDRLGPTEAAIALANPDGYHNTFTSDRLWSKNMQPTSLSFCPGHDIARGLLQNFDDDATQCSESYCGQGSDSPLEVRAINEYAEGFERVVIVQGTERTSDSKVYEINEKISRVSLPDYGSSFLLARNHLKDAVVSVNEAIKTII